MKKIPPAFFRQSAALPYRWRGNHLEILLITSMKRGRWIIPKGVVEKNLTASQSAAKEAFEEGGIQGHMGTDPIGVFTVKKWGGTCTVMVFPMEVTRVFETWPELGKRRRHWFTLEKAVAKIEDPAIKKVLLAFKAGSTDEAARRGE